MPEGSNGNELEAKIDIIGRTLTYLLRNWADEFGYLEFDTLGHSIMNDLKIFHEVKAFPPKIPKEMLEKRRQKMYDDIDKSKQLEISKKYSFKCKVCGHRDSYKSISETIHYFKDLHMNDQRYYKCPNCGIMFFYLESWVSKS